MLREQGAAAEVEDLNTYLIMIHKSGQSLLDLADEILSDGVNRSVIPQEFDLTLFREKLTTLYQPQAAAKRVKLEFVLEPGNQSVPLSRNMLMQIAGNLISNAIKFTSADGKVQVKLGMIVRRIKLFLRIVVSDTGSGMGEKSIQQILLGNAETTPGTMGERGYGLGLSLVKHLVELRGGKLKISSVVGQGSVFEVTLPQYFYLKVAVTAVPVKIEQNLDRIENTMQSSEGKFGIQYQYLSAVNQTKYSPQKEKK